MVRNWEQILSEISPLTLSEKLADSMEQSSYTETDSRSAIIKLSSFLGNTNLVSVLTTSLHIYPYRTK
jgi:hypothetical protein